VTVRSRLRVTSGGSVHQVRAALVDDTRNSNPERGCRMIGIARSNRQSWRDAAGIPTSRLTPPLATMGDVAPNGISPAHTRPPSTNPATAQVAADRSNRHGGRNNVRYSARPTARAAPAILEPR